MSFPAFYDAAPRLSMYDPLSAFLGAAVTGLLEYGYVDAVKLAGHSCPTVAGAYLMTVKALRYLYRDDVPVRGDIEVHVRGAEDEGTSGVVANVAALLTGAARESGFKGIAGRFDRRHLLVFGAPIDGDLAFRRRDTGAGVQARIDTGIVPHQPETRELLQKALSGTATGDEAAQFRALWQDRVRRILVDAADDPRLVQLADWKV